MAKRRSKQRLKPSVQITAFLIMTAIPIAFLFQNCAGTFESVGNSELVAESFSEQQHWTTPDGGDDPNQEPDNDVVTQPPDNPPTNTDDPPSDSNDPSADEYENKFAFRIVDPNNLLGTNRLKVLRHAEAAGVQWTQNIHFEATVQVDIVIADTTTNRFSGRSLANTKIGTFEGRDVFEDAIPHKARTGVDINGELADGEIVVDPDYLSSQLWFDPDPFLRTASVPDDKLDAVSVFMHELGHGLGFNGFRNLETGALPAGYMSVFDKFISVTNTGTYFTGARAVAHYQASVPLTHVSGNSQNLYHYGNPLVMNVPLEYGLMTGYNYLYRTRYWINNLDIAILEDLGLRRGP